MSALLAALLIAALLCFVLVAVRARPFRTRAARGRGRGLRRAARARSAKEAKYAEIRDNETDFRTGKLSEEDYRALDRQLRAEAVEILRALDELESREGGRDRLESAPCRRSSRRSRS